MSGHKIPATTRELICRLYTHGKTLQEIGDIFGVSRERIRQLLRKWGIAQDAGGRHIRAFVNQSEQNRKRLDRRARRIAKMEQDLGCSEEEILRICGDKVTPWTARSHGELKHPGGIYINQRHNAQCRRIEWKLSLPEWWRIWQESGKWELRGRGRGKYVMARLGDRGPYAPGNVYIAEFCENVNDYYRCAEHKVAHRKAVAAGQARATA